MNKYFQQERPRLVNFFHLASVQNYSQQCILQFRPAALCDGMQQKNAALVK
jgi:hypothetical protein